MASAKNSNVRILVAHTINDSATIHVKRDALKLRTSRRKLLNS